VGCGGFGWGGVWWGCGVGVGGGFGGWVGGGGRVKPLVTIRWVRTKLLLGFKEGCLEDFHEDSNRLEL